MKQKIFSRLTLLMVSVICFGVMTSCDDDDDYYAGGFLTDYTWGLQYINNYPVSDAGYCTYSFNPNGTGFYSCYNDYGRWVTLPITWDSDYSGNGALYLDVYINNAGYYENWSYLVRTYGGPNPQLVLTDMDTGDILTFSATY